MNEKVTVISNSRCTVAISIPYLHLKKEWNKKGAKALIDREILEEAMFDPGVEYMFKNGILYIEDMQTKIDLGLEPIDATQPENIIIVSDKQKEEYMSPKRQGWELKKLLESLSKDSRADFCDYVIEHEILDGVKSNIILEVCGVDVLKAIQLKRQDQEANN